MGVGVYHVFVSGNGWHWVATIRADVSEDDVERGLDVMGVLPPGKRVKIVPVDESPVPEAVGVPD
jgi:hypothetical protein